MRLALLGIDDLVPLVASEALQSHEHSLAALADVPDHSAFRQQLTRAVRDEPWEGLLARRDVDAVIFGAEGRAPELRDEQLKRLAQDGIPLLVAHPVCDVMLAYEIEMNRRDVGGLIVPFASDWWHPAFDRLMEWSYGDGTGTAAPVQQLILERYLVDRSRPSILRQFSRDVLLIRRLVGQITSLSAVGVSDNEASLADITIHCVGSQAAARWSIVPPGVAAESKIMVVTGRGTATLRMPPGPSEWRLELRGERESTESFPAWNAAQQALHRMRRALDGEPPSPNWSDVCLDLEAVESVEKSLRRRRAVDVHTGETSEDQTFKGFMAAAGCLILIVIFLSFVFLAVVEGFRLPLREAAPDSAGEGSRWPFWLRLWPVYPLVAFLLLQFLLVFAKRAAKDAQAKERTG